MTVAGEPSPQLIEAVRASDGLASTNVPLKITESSGAGLAYVVTEESVIVASC